MFFKKSEFNLRGDFGRVARLVSLTASLHLLAAAAGAQTPLVNGENHAAAISGAGEVDSWTFSASAGEYLIVSAAEVGSDTAFVPYVRLLSPAGTVITHGWGALVGWAGAYAPAAGTYTVLVSSNDAPHTATGSYVLRLAKAPGAFIVPSGDQGGPFTNGANHQGVIERGDVDLWNFTASAGEYLAVTVAEVGTDTAFVPYVQLINPSGTIISHGWGALVGGAAAYAPAAGTYTVLVSSRDASGAAAGSYIVRLAKAPGTFTVPSGDEGGAFTNGANHTGTIDRGDYDMWSFPASAGEYITVTAAEVGTDTAFVPYVQLVNPSGTIISHGWGALVGGAGAYAPTTGTYTVLVSSRDSAGHATGNYVVRLAKAPSGFIVPPGDEGGTLINGRQTGAIDRGDIDQWSFSATAGRLIEITVAETNGNTGFVPYLRLMGPSGTIVAHGWGDVTARVSLNAPSTGNYRVFVSSNDSGGDDTGTYSLDALGISPPVLLTRGGADAVVDFGRYGLWMRYDHGGTNARWSQLDTRDASVMAKGDLDGNGQTDLVVTFPDAGIRVWMNDAEWIQLHAVDAVKLATGDLDASGRDEVIVSFAEHGTWIWYNNTSWVQLHALPSAEMTTGNLDGDAADRADIVINFAGYGVWCFMNATSWVPLHPLNAPLVRTGDLDGNGRDDIVLDFPGYGVWIYANNSTWVPLHALNVSAAAIGNFDGDVARRKDVALTFPGYGVWSLMNGTTWVPRHGLDAPVMATGDLDASGRDDLLLSFNGYGIWIWGNNASWDALHLTSPDAMLTGHFDEN